ncbi:hypothetical protein PC123_g7073 [Phytophthora cactorum]|nr:hypothetical protein PC120_g20374 [Phytophthora cactorum]KAG4057946.1 hypothetical protein PC123_g7073 [Phytophthora cactorum]
MLRTLPSTEQHGVALGFTVKELLDAATATTSFRTTPRVKLLELHVRSYVGKSVNLFSDGLSGSTLSLQLDVSSTSRRRSRIAKPCRGERARSRAYGRQLTGATCFNTYEVLNEELRRGPPKNEFLSRA